METLVTTDWLSQHLDDPGLVVLDCTVFTEMDEEGGYPHNVSGRSVFDQGHISGAGFADLTHNLCDRDSPIEFALPTPAQFCDAMGQLGVGDASRVVLYDGYLSAWAARVWWMLRWVGFDQAAILDGGLKAWTAESRQLSYVPASPSPKHLTPAVRPQVIADRDEVRAALDNNDIDIIDTMPGEFYRGEQAMYARPGHITGASNISGLDLLDEQGFYRSHDELAALHDGERTARAITYCGGGIMASSNAFVMTRLGFTDVAVYIASLQEWAADPANPMTVETP